MATGLLGGVLPYIYSRADALKRTLGDVVSNPMASTEQVVNNANDRAGNLNRLLSQVAAQGQRGLTSPQGQELAGLYAQGYDPVGMIAKNVVGDVFKLSKQEFLGKPRITKNANAADLKPIELNTLKDAEPQPFMGGKYQIKMNEDGAVVLDKGKPIASYNFGDTLVVDKPYRKSGLAQELVYEWRTSFPAPAVAEERTKASQAIQEKVWERIQNEKRSLPEQSLYPQQAALDLAQQRAALPVEQGGLGLPANNTAADRAKAMGFDVETSYIHSTSNPFTKINEDGKFSGIFTLPNYSANYGTLNMPLVARGEIATSDDLRRLVKKPTKKMQMAIDERIPDNVDIADATVEMQKLRNELARKYGFSGVKVSDEFGQDTTALVNPANIRSRFAAFDPFRKDVATAAAMGVAAPNLLAQPVNQYEPTYETIPMYTDPFGNTIGSSIR